MATTLLVEPDYNNPIALSDGVIFSLLADPSDYQTTAGSKANFTVDFGSGSVPANGTEFTLWGKVFTFDDTTPFSATSFEFTGTAATDSVNFAAMLNANIFFRKVSEVSVNTATGVVTVTWKACGEQSNFDTSATGFDFASLTAAGATCAQTNGIDPVFIEGFKLVWCLGRMVGNVFTPIMEFESSAPSFDCSGAAPLRLDLTNVCSNVLYTPFPDNGCTGDTAEIPLTDAFFKLLYGFVYREDCQPKSGTLLSTDFFKVANVNLPAGEYRYGMRQFVYSHTAGLPPGYQETDLMTSQPYFFKLPIDAYFWAWYWVEHDNSDGLRMSIEIYPIGGGSASTVTKTIGFEDHGMHYMELTLACAVVGASPGILATNVEKIVYWIESDETGVGWTQVSKAYTISFFSRCENVVDVYFRCPAGGIATLAMTRVEMDASQESNIVDTVRNNNELSTRERELYVGRQTIPTSNTMSFRLEFVDAFSIELKRMLIDLRHSKFVWVRERNRHGEYSIRAVNLSSGSMAIERLGEQIVSTVECTWANYGEQYQETIKI